MFVEIVKFRDIKHRLVVASETQVQSYVRHETCPACGSTEDSEPAIRLGQPGWATPLRFSVCPVCTHGFYENPPSQVELDHFYDTLFAVGKQFDSGSPGKSHKLSRMLTSIGISSGDHPRILDVGCGYGTNLAGLLEAGYQDLYGCEPSANRAAVARTLLPDRIGNHGWEGIDSSTKYDVIFSNHVFEHLRDPLLALHHLSKLVTDEGMIIINVPDARVESPINQSLYLPHLSSFTPRSLRAMADAAGSKTYFWPGAESGELSGVLFRNRSPVPETEREPDPRFSDETIAEVDQSWLIDRIRAPWLISAAGRKTAITWYFSGSRPWEEAKGRTFSVLSSVQAGLMPGLHGLERLATKTGIQAFYFPLTRAMRVLSSVQAPISSTSYMELKGHEQTDSGPASPLIGTNAGAPFTLK